MERDLSGHRAVHHSVVCWALRLGKARHNRRSQGVAYDAATEVIREFIAIDLDTQTD